ncbi:hypothetical protein GWK47_038964 [Chionoecetes opilio]|uniref:Uncharacterized protein n=1 Tax=Chionoecetes opilio TaxID=41210 RepID=A0A8J4YDF1_CHIOP|nr:hypothetical protein GWK47_038964 [Chionoecetes opilio]
MFAWLKERGFEKTLLAIGGDSTYVNTCVKVGVMRKLELHLWRKLVWLVGNVHTGVLPLRHLIVGLDGPTLSDKKISGSIGKLLDSATDFEINPNFTGISVGPPPNKLPDKVIQDISTDQHYGYKIVCAVRDGVLPVGLALLEIGPVNDNRWLTTANRLLRLWVKQHGLKEKNRKNLHFILEFIIGVYYPCCWFNVKVKHSWIEGSRHILFQLDCLKSQRKEVLDIVMPTENICLDKAWDTLDRSKVSNVEVPLGPGPSLNPCLRPLGLGPPDRGSEDEGAAARFVPLRAWKGARVAMREDSVGEVEDKRTSGTEAGRVTKEERLVHEADRHRTQQWQAGRQSRWRRRPRFKPRHHDKDKALDTLDRSKVSNVQVPLGPGPSLNPCLRPLGLGPPDRGSEDEGAAARYVPLRAWKGARVAMREDSVGEVEDKRTSGTEAGRGKLID